MTKCDQPKHPEIPNTEELRAFATEHGFADFYETTARDPQHQVLPSISAFSLFASFSHVNACFILQGINEAFDQLVDRNIKHSEYLELISRRSRSDGFLDCSFLPTRFVQLFFKHGMPTPAFRLYSLLLMRIH
jgi:hypothetical protein